MTVADIIQIMEEMAPARLAEDWDNVGLQVGRKDGPVRKIRVALDPLPEVVSAACQGDADLLITHHPLIFRPLRTVDFNTPSGSVIRMAARHHLAIFSAHTNLDSVRGGINDVLALKIGMDHSDVLADEAEPGSGEGIGRIGALSEPTTLSALASELRARLRLKAVKYAGPADLSVTTAALCSGSGGGLMGRFLSSDAQVYISGDFRYHEARDAEMAGRGLIDIGHFASEHLMVTVLADRLRERLKQSGINAAVEACTLERDPFTFL
ncbi:Nif3-like dinuclear metal center hexameric protein [Desulfonema ishimotonii]|uniref:Nif3-like dinuclear metal center hexameric protein n=1 Tax=Desulfonema ishimotonii TaxID=45657 RepID=UPI000F58996E|nr:Nif3-like dinuclear metal center hexameric protein [Desulfonema ishimotonii]